MEEEPILRLWLNHDTDLVDVSAQGKTSQQKEIIHTSRRHPFLTKEQGFSPVSQLKPGMHVLEADDGYGVIARIALAPGTLWMYNLTVAQNHTYAVGSAQWIVHNCALTAGLNSDDPGSINGFSDILDAHYKAHGAENGTNATSPDGYNQKAIDFIKGNPTGEEKQIWNPVTGKLERHDPVTGLSGVYSIDEGRMVTFFNLNQYQGANAQSHFYRQYRATLNNDGVTTGPASGEPANPTATDVNEAAASWAAEDERMLRLLEENGEYRRRSRETILLSYSL